MEWAQKHYLLCIFSTKTQKRWVAQSLCTSRLSLGGSLRDSLEYKMESQAAFSQLVLRTGKVFVFIIMVGAKGRYVGNDLVLEKRRDI